MFFRNHCYAYGYHPENIILEVGCVKANVNKLGYCYTGELSDIEINLTKETRGDTRITLHSQKTILNSTSPSTNDFY